MLNKRCLIFVFLLSFFKSYATSDSKVYSASRDPRWLSLYQYKVKGRHIRSDIQNEAFFFSKLGYKNPETEFKAALEAYQSPSTLKFGIQKLSAACAFPARKKRIEEILKIKMPELECPDLKKWKESLKAEKLSLLFAGPYLNNPASILGHTFLRLARGHEKREGSDLLSYTISFLAQADPNDTGISYAVNGVSGFYPAFYDIKPHYMNVALYNNSESRDLWEYEINFTKDETDFLVDYLWELLFNAEFRYYFLDENCAYRLLTLLEAVRPESQLTKNQLGILLPVNTIRSLKKQHFLSDEAPKFRASVKRLLASYIKKFTKQEKSTYSKLIEQRISAEEIQSPELLDAAILRFKYETYKNQTRVSEDFRTFEYKLLEKRSQLGDAPTKAFIDYSPDQPLAGHKSSWLKIDTGVQGTKPIMALEAFMGAHRLQHNDKAFDNVDELSFFGIKIPYNFNKKKYIGTELTLVEVYSLANYEETFRNLSWNFDFKVRQFTETRTQDLWNLKGEGALGLSHHLDPLGLKLFTLISTRAFYAHSNGPQGQIFAGLNTGMKLSRHDFNILLHHKIFFKEAFYWSLLNLESRYFLGENASLVAAINNLSSSLMANENRATFAYEVFF